jgi:dTDP-glucose 4,6-dehydratase
MRILVTGGLGFIGSNFITWILDRRSDVYIINVDKCTYCSNIKNVLANPRHHHIKADITDHKTLREIFEVERPDVVMHFAAQSHVDNSFGDPIQFTIDNVIGTHVIVHVAHEYGRLQKFIHISTDEVYGEVGPGETSDEKSLLNPTNPYAASKAAAEFIVRSYGHSFKFPWIITRGNNVFGPKQYIEKLIPKFINQIATGVPCTVHGSGHARRNFIYVDDVSNALQVILEKAELNRFYNIGTTNEFSVLEIFEKLAKPGSSIIYVPDRPFNDSRYCVDSRALMKLGWREEVPFDEAIKRTVEWYAANKDWWL